MREPKGFMSEKGYAEHLNRRLEQAERELAELRQYSAMRDKDLRAARDHAEKRSEEATKAERERDEWKRHAQNWKCDANTLQCERDDWKRKALEVEETVAWRKKQDAFCAQSFKWDTTEAYKIGREEMTAERDAALAKAEGFQRDQKEATETALRNMAKAEAAEELAEQTSESEAYNLAGWQAAEKELTDLRARIEALADEWEEYGTYPQMLPELRALLQPPKAETALEITDRATKAPDCDAWVLSHEDFAKLRKLIKEQK